MRKTNDFLAAVPPGWYIYAPKNIAYLDSIAKVSCIAYNFSIALLQATINSAKTEWEQVTTI